MLEPGAQHTMRCTRHASRQRPEASSLRAYVNVSDIGNHKAGAMNLFSPDAAPKEYCEALRLVVFECLLAVKHQCAAVCDGVLQCKMPRVALCMGGIAHRHSFAYEPRDLPIIGGTGGD